jgi:hypothetical protein
MNAITRFVLLSCGVGAIFMGAGCGKGANDSAPTAEQNMAAGMRAVGQAEMDGAAKSSPAPQTDLPKGDSNVLDSAYADLKNDAQLGELFYALSGLPPNYQALDSYASEEYRRTTDAFRKRDLEKALQPQIDQAIADYKDPSKRYFKFKLDGAVNLGHYDFATKSFPVREDFTPNLDHFFNGGYAGVYGNLTSNYKFNLANGKDFTSFPVPDETRAKQIEGMIASNQLYGGATILYVFAQGSDDSANRIQMQIMRVTLLDRDQKEVGRYGAPGAHQ